jgi:hypothetical protein
MFADFQTWIGGQLFWLFVVIGGWCWIIKHYANPKVKGAAKEAITNQAVSWISRLGKK